jgi:hypothetical protein
LDPAAGTEVICIVRSRNDPSARSWVVVLEHPSSDLLDRLDQESRRQIRTALEASAGAAGAAAIASRPLGGGQGSSGDRIVRGQSADE